MIRLNKQNIQIIVIDLEKEYQNNNIQMKWAIITDLTESEIQSLFVDELRAYSPYLILSEEQGKAIFSFHKNNEKFKWRYRNKEICGLSDEVVSAYREDGYNTYKTEDVFNQIIHNEVLYQALSTLTEKQKNRIIMHFIEGLTEREIGDLEGVDHKSVNESIATAIKKLKNSPLLKQLMGN